MPAPRAWMLLFPLLGLPLTTCGENLVPNPSLEEMSPGASVPALWSTRGGGARVEFPADGGHTGQRYARFVDTRKDAGILLESARVACRPGGLYRAAAWFRTADACSPGVYLNFYDDLGVRVHNVFRRVPGPTAGWAQAVVEGRAPLGALQVSVGLYAYVGDVGTFDADDAEMTVQGGLDPGQGQIPRVQTGEKGMMEIGSRRELFVDSALVDGLSGQAERRLHHPVPREVVLRFDQPWEGKFCGYVTVMNDDGKVRLYYRGWGEVNHGDCTCVAESEDGVHFVRPKVGAYEVNGSRDNNVIWQGRGSHNFTPFKDANRAAPESERYKALASAGPKDSLVAFVSPDGLHWRKLREEPVITEGAFDSQNLAFWDSLRGEYVEYHRGFRDGVRDIMVCRSKDFIHWSKPEWLDYGDVPPEHLYTNAITPYFRAPHIYLGFPCRFVPGRKKVADHPEMGINDGVLVSSRDGLHFERWVEAFLRPGSDPLCWTDRNNYLAWGMAQTSPTEISVYWNEHYRYPTAYLRRGTLRLDGFVSIHAGAEGGEVVTRPLVFTGKRLVLNYETSAIGSVRVELCDEAGNAYPGFGLAQNDGLFGNEIEATVTWQGQADVSALAGKPVRVRIQVRDADVYALQFTE